MALQTAASQSQHVTNILTNGDPVNYNDVDKVEQDERANNNTGLLEKGGPTAKVQVSNNSSFFFRLVCITTQCVSCGYSGANPHRLGVSDCEHDSFAFMCII